MGSSAKPTAPANPAKTYAQAVQTNIRYAPEVADAEQNLRAQYDNTSVAANLDRQAQTGPGFIDLYRNQLAHADPGNEALQKQLGGAISTNLATGYSLDAGTIRQVQQTTRAGQVASGNVLGNAAVSKEATAVGTASFQAFQRRITGATTFLQQDRALQNAQFMEKLTTGDTLPDRSNSYVSSAAGLDSQNLLNETYQEDLQYAQNYSANVQADLGPWQRAAQGAYIGLREGWQGGSLVSFVGGAFGAIGGALGGSFQGLINAPDYQWNVSLNQYNLYGSPVGSTEASAAGFAGSVALSAASTYG